MEENSRIAQLFSAAYDGSPWIDVNLVETLQSISPKIAAQKIRPNSNSIWEIVNHLIAWRENVLQRVKGKIMTTPDHNYFTAIEDLSETAWQQSLQDLATSQENWIDFLRELDETALAKIYPKNNHTYYEHIHGILHHDAYHLGQIVLLKKLLGS